MKIKIINPNTSNELTAGIYESACAVKRSDSEIICTNPPHGPICIESTTDEAIATYYLIEELKKSEAEGCYDAYIIACFGDPGVDALRELTDKPVIGIAEAAIHMCAFISAKFSIVSILPRVRKHLEELVHRAGAENRLASIKTPNLGVMAFHENEAKAKKTLIDASRDAVNDDLAECIILGCAGMTGFSDIVSKEIGVPVLDSVCIAVKTAEALVDLGVKTSKSNTYALPTYKEYK